MAVNPYIDAVTDLDLPRVRDMLSNNPKWLTWCEPSGKNALHYLCGLRFKDDPAKEQKSLEILKFLLKSGMDMNSTHRIPDPNCGFFPGTPVWYAYSRGPKERLYKYLLKQGADPSNCWWAISWFDDVAAAKLFLKYGAKLDPEPGIDNLFVGAIGWKRFKFAYWLLTLGADVNAVGPNGDTALILSVKRKDEENIAKLMKQGADPDRKNEKGLSARDIATAKGPKRLSTLLGPRTARPPYGARIDLTSPHRSVGDNAGGRAVRGPRRDR